MSYSGLASALAKSSQGITPQIAKKDSHFHLNGPSKCALVACAFLSIVALFLIGLVACNFIQSAGIKGATYILGGTFFGISVVGAVATIWLNQRSACFIL